jgi:RNA polymerase sigma factor (sigma-70 family)
VSYCVPRSHRSAASADSALTLAACGGQENHHRSKASALTPFLPHLSAARRYAGRKVAANEVDDIVQDSLVRIMAAQSGAEIQYPKSYLIMVVQAVIVDHLRRDTRTRRKDHLELTDAAHPVDMICPCRIVMGRQELSRFTKELNALPTRTRDMLLAIRVEGLSFKATAERFNVCVSTVEKQVSRALARLAAVS